MLESFKQHLQRQVLFENFNFYVNLLSFFQVSENLETFKEEICLVFGLKEKIGALADALKIFEENNVNLIHIESRLSKNDKGKYEFFVDCKSKDKDNLQSTIEKLKEKASYLHVFDKSAEGSVEESIPWFPTRIKELDQFANRILSYGAELDSDHPGFTDPVYRERRKEFADIAFNYKQ